MNYTHSPNFEQPTALPAGFKRYKLLGTCVSCSRADVPTGAKPMRLPHWPNGLAAWACLPCWQAPSDPRVVMRRLMIPEGKDTGCTVAARFPEGVQ